MWVLVLICSLFGGGMGVLDSPQIPGFGLKICPPLSIRDRERKLHCEHFCSGVSLCVNFVWVLLVLPSLVDGIQWM